MKQALTGAVIFWLASFFLRAAGPGIAQILMVIAVALSVLWLLHIMVFTHYAIRSARIVNLLRGAQQPPVGMFTAFVKGIVGGIVSSVPRVSFFQAGGMPPCDCYFHKDCTFYIVSLVFLWCNYSDPCYWVQKGEPGCSRSDQPGGCDGTCQWFGHLWVGVDPNEVMRTLDLQFQAFHHAATHLAGPGQPGLPNETLLEEARRTKLPAGWHDELQSFVFSALEVVLGRDFELGQRGECDDRERHIKAFLAHIEDEAAMPRFILAARDAFVNAVRENNVDEVEQPLRDFWEEYPSYVPAHGGRCYPHGHDVYDTAIECQIAHFRSMLSALLSTRQELRVGRA